MPEIALQTMQCFRAGEFSRFAQYNWRFAASTRSPYTDRKKKKIENINKNVFWAFSQMCCSIPMHTSSKHLNIIYFNFISSFCVVESPETVRLRFKQYKWRRALRNAKHFYFKCFTPFAISSCSTVRLIQFRLFSGWLLAWISISAVPDIIFS